jgi:hypothetical protein
LLYCWYLLHTNHWLSGLLYKHYTLLSYCLSLCNSWKYHWPHNYWTTCLYTLGCYYPIVPIPHNSFTPFHLSSPCLLFIPFILFT